MLFVDYNSTIRDLFRDVEGVSQHGIEELFDQDVVEGRRSYAEALIDAGIATREDILSLVSQYLGYELQEGEVGEIDADILAMLPAEVARQYGAVPLYASEESCLLYTSDAADE